MSRFKAQVGNVTVRDYDIDAIDRCLVTTEDGDELARVTTRTFADQYTEYFFKGSAEAQKMVDDITKAKRSGGDIGIRLDYELNKELIPPAQR